jgi:hypothetical protein
MGMIENGYKKEGVVKKEVKKGGHQKRRERAPIFLRCFSKRTEFYLLIPL